MINKSEDTEDDISGDNKDIADNGKSQQLKDSQINELKTQLQGFLSFFHSFQRTTFSESLFFLKKKTNRQGIDQKNCRK